MIDAEAAGMDAGALKRIEAIVERYVDDKTIPGAVVLAARGNRVGYLAAIGKRNETHGLKTNDIFQITSVSKAVLGVAMMLLIDQGLLSAGDELRDYIPEYADMTVAHADVRGRIRPIPARRPLTIHHLLSMTSGGVNAYTALGSQNTAVQYVASELSSRGVEMAFGDRTVSIEDSVRRMAPVPLANHPGEEFIYSEYNCLLLARVVELVSGMPYQDYLELNVFRPLGMVDTTFQPDTVQLPRVAAMYRAHDSTEGPKGALVTDSILTEDGNHVLFDPRHSRRPGDTGIQPGAGLYSTVGDIYRFAGMLANDGVAVERSPTAGERFLSSEAVHLMTTNRIGNLFNPITDNKWGYMVSVQFRGHPTTIYYGAVGGFGRRGASGPEFWVDPKYHTLVVVMTQAWWSFDLAGLKARIAQVVNRSVVPQAEE